MTIVVTDSFPFADPDSVTLEVLNSYPVCQTINKTPDLQETVTCTSTLHGRYVVIFITSGEKLFMCEVEVYGSSATDKPGKSEMKGLGLLNTIIVGETKMSYLIICYF